VPKIIVALASEQNCVGSAREDITLLFDLLFYMGSSIEK
jgi:hypothetical protein